jgi:hypothetical protein
MQSTYYLSMYLEPLQKILASALNSLGGKSRNGLDEAYKGYCAVLINRAAVGFLCLKKNELDYSARMLIRPALEAMFKLLAVKQEPAVLYRIARHEHEEDEKWARPFATCSKDVHDESFKRKWEDFKKEYQQAFPTHPLTDSSISLRSLAAKAKVDPYYDSHYRLYCQFTHATLRASADDLEDFSKEDERTVVATLIVAIESVQDCGGHVEGFATLRDEFLAENKNGEQDAPSNGG